MKEGESYEEERTDAAGVTSANTDENKVDLRELRMRPTLVSCNGTEAERKIDSHFDKIRDTEIRRHCKSNDEAREKIDTFQCSVWRVLYEFYKKKILELLCFFVKSDTFESFIDFVDGDTQQEKNLREQLEAQQI